MSMVKEKVLDRNIFSMCLRKPRKLIFGAVNHDRPTGELVKVLLTNKTGRYTLTGRWQAEAGYLTLGSEAAIRMSLAGYTASFFTGSAFILLTDSLVKDIWQDLRFEEIMLLPPSVACEQGRLMPDITFNSAGKSFLFTRYDYTLQWLVEHGKAHCMSAILPFGVEQFDGLVLSSAFLPAFYSVFDLGMNILGCKSAPSLFHSG